MHAGEEAMEALSRVLATAPKGCGIAAVMTGNCYILAKMKIINELMEEIRPGWITSTQEGAEIMERHLRDGLTETARAMRDHLGLRTAAERNAQG
jgi:hypothetical protein